MGRGSMRSQREMMDPAHGGGCARAHILSFPLQTQHRLHPHLLLTTLCLGSRPNGLHPQKFASRTVHRFPQNTRLQMGRLAYLELLLRLTSLCARTHVCSSRIRLSCVLCAVLYSVILSVARPAKHRCTPLGPSLDAPPSLLSIGLGG